MTGTGKPPKSSSSPAPPSTVALPPRQTSSGIGAVLDRLVQQLAEAAARRPQRVALGRRDAAQPDRLRRLDDGRPVAEHEPARLDGPAERVGDLRRAPLPAEGAVEHGHRPLAAVGDRRLVHLPARGPEALGERGRRLPGRQHPLEASRRR